MCVKGEQNGFVSNYTTLRTVISENEKRGRAVLQTWDTGKDGGGWACIICEFCLGQED